MRTKKLKSHYFWEFAFTRQPPHPAHKRHSILGHPPCLANAVINYRVSLDRRFFHVCRGRDGHSGRHFRGHPRDFPVHSSNATQPAGGRTPLERVQTSDRRPPRSSISRADRRVGGRRFSCRERSRVLRSVSITNIGFSRSGKCRRKQAKGGRGPLYGCETVRRWVYEKRLAA